MCCVYFDFGMCVFVWCLVFCCGGFIGYACARWIGVWAISLGVGFGFSVF